MEELLVEMVKFLIMIPVFNDWDSLKKLLLNIDNEIKNLKYYNEFIHNSSFLLPNGVSN